YPNDGHKGVVRLGVTHDALDQFQRRNTTPALCLVDSCREPQRRWQSRRSEVFRFERHLVNRASIVALHRKLHGVREFSVVWQPTLSFLVAATNRETVLPIIRMTTRVAIESHLKTIAHPELVGRVRIVM